MVKSKSFKLITLLLIISLIFAGCTPAKSNEGTKETKGSAETKGAASNEKIIRMSVSGTPKVDPATGNNSSDSVALVNLYDSLVYPKNDGTVVPSLADSWEYDESNLSYTFKLKQGVKFHSGTELTAKDVAFSMNRLLAIGEGNAYLFEGIVKETVAVDDYTVKFILNKPFGPFVTTLTRLYIVSEEQIMANIDPSGAYGEFGDYGKNWMISNDAGSGPYALKELQQQGYLLADRFKDYWGGWENANAPDTIKLIDNTEASTIRTLIGNKDLEITDEWQSTENVEAMSKIPGVAIAKINTGMVQNMMYNNQKAPTDDANYRKALNYLFDYKMISENILVESPVAKGPVSAHTPGCAPKLTQYTFDIEKAKEYLQKSKYANEIAKYPINLLVNTDVADHEKIALAFQAAAQKVGITVNISKAPWISIQEQVAKVDTTPNVVCISVAPHYMEAGSMLLSRYHSNSVGTWEQAEWLQSKEIDSMIEDALATADNQERFNKYSAIQEKLVDEIVPTAWLVDLVQRCVYRSDYVEWPVAEQGGALPLGYACDFRYIKIYPEKK